MQFTGLTDRKGVEIYEDDLVKSEKGIVYRVIWSVRNACFVVVTPNRWKNAGLTIYKSMPYAVERLTVCGNIHEHPELLQGGE